MMAGFISYILASLSLLQSQSDPVVTYAGRYSDENGVSIEVLGVCEIGEEKLSAWDAKGKNDPTLADSIRGYLKETDFPDLQYRYECKNRYIAVRYKCPDGADISYRCADSNSQIWQAQSTGAPSSTFVLIPAFADKNQKETSLIATVPAQKIESIDFSSKSNQTKTLGGNKYKLKTVKAITSDDLAGFEDNEFIAKMMLLETNNKAWAFFFEMPESDPNQVINLILKPKDKTPITAVDVNGHPVPLTYKDLKLMPYDSVYHVPADPKTFAAAAAHIVVRQKSTKPILATNINLDHIKGVQLIKYVSKTIVLDHIPLDKISD